MTANAYNKLVLRILQGRHACELKLRAPTLACHLTKLRITKTPGGHALHTCRVSASVTGDDPSVHGQQKQRSSQLEIKPQREGSAVAYGQLADAIRQAVKAVIFLISAGEHAAVSPA